MIGRFLKGLFKKGFTISYSSGKPFDPIDQERTDAVRDIIKTDTKKGGEDGRSKSGNK